MEHTLAAVFDDRSAAQQAMDALVRAGCSKDHITLKDSSEYGMKTPATDETIHTEGFGDSVKHFFSDLFGTGHADTHVYSEAVTRGKCVLTLESDDQDEVERAAAIVEGYGPIDIEEHEKQWRAGGWTGAEAARSGGTWQQAASMQQSAPHAGETNLGTVQGTQANLQGTQGAQGTQGSLQGSSQGSMQRAATSSVSDTGIRSIPVMQEELKVGKRVIDRGGVRVYQRLIETPVEQDISLQEEHVNIRRRPVDKPADPADLAAFKEGSFVLRESEEEAVVQKTARVVEEVDVGKEVKRRDKHIKDKVRRTEVDVEKLAATGRSYDTTEDDNYYRQHWTSTFSKAGGKYEDYAPAYRYGSSMADTDSYRGRDWDQVEPELRSRWESTYPGSAWEKFKAAVRHGWDRITS